MTLRQCSSPCSRQIPMLSWQADRSRSHLLVGAWRNVRRIHVQTSTEQMLSALYHESAVASQWLERIVEEVPNLGPASRVIIVNCGTGALIPSLQVYLRAKPRRISAVQVFCKDVVPSEFASFDKCASSQSETQLQ